MNTIRRIKTILSAIFHRHPSAIEHIPTTSSTPDPIIVINPFDEIQQNPDEYGCPI